MNPQIDALDRLIDALNAHLDPADDPALDEELASLMWLARGLKALGHTEWPDDDFPARAATRLSQRLRPPSPASMDAQALTDVDANGHRPPIVLPVRDPHTGRLGGRRLPSGFRKTTELAAAIIVLVMFTALLAALFRARLGGTPSFSPAGQPPPTAGVSEPAPVKPLSDLYPVIRQISQAGNGKGLHLVQTDGGFTVTLDWVGVDADRVLLGVILRGPSNMDLTGIEPASINVSDPAGTPLTGRGADCTQFTCLLQFDRPRSASNATEVPLTAEIVGISTQSNAAGGSFASSAMTTGSSASGQALSLGTPTVAANFRFSFSVPGMPPAAPSPTPASAREVSDPALMALQQAAGFRLYAPGLTGTGASVVNDLSLDNPKPPMSLPGFTSVTLTYRDGSGSVALTITEASPYQETRDTMPSAVFDNSVQQDLENGTPARLYQSDTSVQIWWQQGPTSVRLESDAGAGMRLLSKDEMLAIATYMAPVARSSGEISVPSDALVKTADAAVTRAKPLLSTLGGNPEATASNVRLVTLADEVALGMPRPNGVDPSAAVWEVEFADGMVSPNCQQQTSSNSLCSHGQLVAVVDAMSGQIFGYHDQGGTWKRPS